MSEDQKSEKLNGEAELASLSQPQYWLTDEEHELLWMLKEDAKAQEGKQTWRCNWPYERVLKVAEGILARDSASSVVASRVVLTKQERRVLSSLLSELPLEPSLSKETEAVRLLVQEAKGEVQQVIRDILTNSETTPEPKPGWLTLKERVILNLLIDGKVVDIVTNLKDIRLTMRSILHRRHYPPTVVVPDMLDPQFLRLNEIAQKYRDAISKAGLEWIEEGSDEALGKPRAGDFC